MSKLNELLSKIISKLNASVKTEAQSFSEEEKAQARANIGAISEDNIPITSINGQTGDVVFDIPVIDPTLSISGHAADAKAVGDAINAIPVSTTDDGYTEITGLRQAISTNIVKSGNAITVTTALEGDETTTSEITLNSEGYPTTIVTDGVECVISWDGFDTSTTAIDITLDEINGEEI